MSQDKHNIESILVEQKDHIKRLLANDKPSEALSALAVVADLWRLADYGYKLLEIARQIKSDYYGTQHAAYAGLIIATLKYTKAV